MRTMTRIRVLFTWLMLGMLGVTPVAFAAEPKIVSGTQQLASDALTWILILVPITGAFMIGYHGWMKSMADGDESTIAGRNRKMKNTLISVVVAECASGIIASLLAYYA